MAQTVPYHFHTFALVRVSVTQGGLWFISQPAQKMFFQTEDILRESLKLVYKKLIFLVLFLSQSVAVVSLYNIMLLEAELEPVDQIRKSVLYSIVNLYVRVRSFSLAKDIIMCHKIDIKKSKDKSLRKEISRSCHEQEQANGRQD